MSPLLKELRILHRKAIYPGKYGGNIRTLNIARLASGIFKHTTIFSADNSVNFSGKISGIPVIQEKDVSNYWEKFHYYFNALTKRELIFPYPQKAFENPDDSLFQIEDPRFYPLLKKNHITRFILDEHNANWEMLDFPYSTIKERIYVKLSYNRERKTEREALVHASHVLCCSVRDRETLIHEIPDIEDRISIIPNCVNVRDYENSPADTIEYDERSSHRGRILFIGIMTYPPNIDAARKICDVIAPMRLNCDFFIVGKNPPKIRCSENVKFTGYIEDLTPLLSSADICIAPLRYGSGTRIKILEYMAMGKAVISTSKGAEGIEYTHGWNIIIEDSIEKYPEIIQGLLEDEKKRLALGREGRKLIETKYDWELYREPLKKIYRDAMETGQA